jgi:hypothetical protein
MQHSFSNTSVDMNRLIARPSLRLLKPGPAMRPAILQLLAIRQRDFLNPFIQKALRLQL